MADVINDLAHPVWPCKITSFFPCRNPPPTTETAPSPSYLSLHDRLQLSGIPQHILNHNQTDVLLWLLATRSRPGLGGTTNGGEEDVAVAHGPAALAGELDDGALRVEEEQ